MPMPHKVENLNIMSLLFMKCLCFERVNSSTGNSSHIQKALTSHVCPCEGSVENKEPKELPFHNGGLIHTNIAPELHGSCFRRMKL